jgi:hypothetical protein
VCSEHVAAEGAIAESRDSAGFRHGVVGGKKGFAHAARDRAGDEEDVRVARGGDEPESEALQVVVGAACKGELVLAAVARAGVDVAEREASATVRARQGDCSAEAAEVAEECQHQRSAQA